MNYEKTRRLILAAPQKSPMENAASVQNKLYIAFITICLAIQKITEDNWLRKDMFTSIRPGKVKQKSLTLLGNFVSISNTSKNTQFIKLVP